MALGFEKPSREDRHEIEIAQEVPSVDRSYRSWPSGRPLPACILGENACNHGRNASAFRFRLCER